VHRPPPAEPDPPRPLAPSRLSGAEPPALSPLAVQGRNRFKRGLLVHRLLQALPELPIEEREIAARRFLALPTHGLLPRSRLKFGAKFSLFWITPISPRCLVPGRRPRFRSSG